MRQVTLQSHLVTPAKIVCVGRNYVEHAHELHNEVPTAPILFIKPNSAIGEELRYREGGIRFEGELCFMVKEGAFRFVAFGLDLTLADTQNTLKSKGHPWERSKAFPDSALFSDFVSFRDITKLHLKLFKNDTLVQEAGFDLMIWKPDFLFQESKDALGLDDYDILMSGTPKGVGGFVSGDILRGEIYEEEELLISKTWICE